jgi:hypothetical protein
LGRPSPALTGRRGGNHLGLRLARDARGWGEVGRLAPRQDWAMGLVWVRVGAMRPTSRGKNRAKRAVKLQNVSPLSCRNAAGGKLPSGRHKPSKGRRRRGGGLHPLLRCLWARDRMRAPCGGWT